MAKIKVMFMSAEASPFIKVGGLGDVAGSLPLALHSLENLHERDGVDVRLVIPLHGPIRKRDYPLQPVATFSINHTLGPQNAEIFQTEVAGLTVYLIAGEMIPDSGPVYSGDPQIDGRKFIFFSLASLQLARSL